MAWFGDSLSGLSHLKGQITNFTKEVLSEGIVKEIDDQTMQLKEANERCIQLQELLDTKDAEISVLRRQNCELQKIVLELDTKTKVSNENQEEDGDVFFWDPTSIKNRNSKNQNHARQLQEQLAQATMKIRELEVELKRTQKVNNGSIMDELPDGHQKAEYLRAKQDMVNRIVRMEEKNREVERNVKRMQEDEIALVNDFYTVISKLDYQEKVKLIREALRNLENDKQKSSLIGKKEKSDTDEKFDKTNENNESENFKSDIQDSSSLSNREAELSRKILELQDENKNLNIGIEELDRQHTESIEKLLSLKEDIEKKHQCLQNAYEQLYVDYNQAEGKVLELQTKLNSMEETNKSPLKKESLKSEEKNVQTEEYESNRNKGRKDDNDNDNNDNSLYELEQRVKEILKNSCVETSESKESIFEIVAKRYVETNWKKDVLERKVTEITRNLKETTEMRDNLQLECDDMQAHIDSLLLNIQHLKLNLPSIPEASEERVASLETETESLQEEVKRLREENDTLRKRSNITDLISLRLENGEINLEENFIDNDNVVEIVHSDVRRREEDSVEDLKRKLLEFSNETSELRMSLEKYKETIEELRLGKENIAHELKASVCSMEELERELKVTLDVKNELERENGDLIKENEVYRADLARFKETADDSKKEENNLLEQLREKLDMVNIERNDLEYDLLNMRKELDNALHEADVKQELIMQLSQEKEKFTRENTTLLDQLTANQVESQEKIELLNTERSLLEEEQSELRLELVTCKEKIQQLANNEDKYAMINYEFDIARKKINELLSENNVLYGQLDKIHELEKELNEKRAAENELHLLKNKFIETEAELNNLRLKEKEIAAKELNLLQSKFIETETELNNLRLKEKEMAQVQGDYNEIVILRETITDLNNKICLSEEKCKQLETNILSLESETNEKILSKENSFENERHKLTNNLEEKNLENEGLKDINNKLTMEIIEMKNQLESTIEANKENSIMAKETIESLSHLIKEKDNEIESLKLNNQANAANSNDLLTIQNERDELVKLVHVKHNESIQYHGEIQRLTLLLNEQASQVRNLLTEQNQITTLLKDKDIELAETRNELQILQQRLENNKETDNNDEICRIPGHLTQVQEMGILNDKCNALEAALIQEQSNNRMLQNQFVESQSKEVNAGKELERLRTHLVEIESSYTEEALIAEEMRKELEGKLLQAEEKLKNSSTVYTSASIRANQQVETLQQQMSLIIQQRDDIQNKLSMAEDKVLSQMTALTNLQIVLEQFQREKERDIKRAMEKLQLQLQESHKKQEELLNEISCLKEQLTEAQEYLQAASRLSEQLDKKTERIEQLNQEVERLTELVNTADQRIEEAMQSGVGKVDKSLMKNLLLGYLSSSTADKSSVLRVFATVLDFTENDRDKAGLNNGIANNSWFSRLSGGNGAPTKDQEASLSAAFVRFLESESKPKPQLPALPISSSSSPRPTHSRQHSTSSNHSTLLLSNVTLPTFPDFVPARNTGSILKEVLKDS
ncbi:thyroid receptor-interacting protein 11-like isoform X2 [Vespa mandarinia]|uniref:thyroid receptor-interacting protein 11-like isoform X2 n=2 Tax=Vespa mandarinia TaxID=7446 RepID=UPI00160DE2CB|nr:thyroid receptor-interacting protein 11-like isoform X2 [Vespa mandarinia]